MGNRPDYGPRGPPTFGPRVPTPVGVTPPPSKGSKTYYSPTTVGTASPKVVVVADNRQRGRGRGRRRRRRRRRPFRHAANGLAMLRGAYKNTKNDIRRVTK